MRLNKSLYRLKYSGHNWFKKLRSGLTDRHFVQNQIDKYIFYKDGCVILIYADYCIFIGNILEIVDSFIYSLHDGDEDFEITYKGSLDKYIGILIKGIADTSFKMSQPFMIRRINASLSLGEHKTRGRETPLGNPLLYRYLYGCPRKQKWLYQGAIGMLSYLANSVLPDIQMAVHQTNFFSMHSMRSHELDIL